MTMYDPDNPRLQSNIDKMQKFFEEDCGTLEDVAKAIAETNKAREDEMNRLRAEISALREAIKIALTCTPSKDNVYDCGDPWVILKEAYEKLH